MLKECQNIAILTCVVWVHLDVSSPVRGVEMPSLLPYSRPLCSETTTVEAFGMGGEGVIVVVHDCGVSDRRPPNPCIAGVALVRFLTSAALTAHLNGGKPRYQECLIMWCGVVWCGVVWCGGVWCGRCGVVWKVWCGRFGLPPLPPLHDHHAFNSLATLPHHTHARAHTHAPRRLHFICCCCCCCRLFSSFFFFPYSCHVVLVLVLIRASVPVLVLIAVVTSAAASAVLVLSLLP